LNDSHFIFFSPRVVFLLFFPWFQMCHFSGSPHSKVFLHALAMTGDFEDWRCLSPLSVCAEKRVPYPSHKPAPLPFCSCSPNHPLTSSPWPCPIRDLPFLSSPNFPIKAICHADPPFRCFTILYSSHVERSSLSSTSLVRPALLFLAVENHEQRPASTSPQAHLSRVGRASKLPYPLSHS